MKRLLKVLLVLIVIIALIIGVQIGLNKIDKTNYTQLDSADQEMFKELSKVYENFRSSSDKIWDASYNLDKMPIVLTRVNKYNGMFIQYSYVVNFDGAKSMFNAQAITMPKELNLPTVYRLDRIAPSTLLTWVPGNSGSLKMDGTKIFYFKYYPDMITTSSLHFDFPSVLLKDSFRVSKQADWTYDKSGGDEIKDYPNNAESYALMGMEFKLLDKMLATNDVNVVKDSLEKFTVVRKYRYEKWPQLHGESNLEAMEGSRRYVEYRYSQLIGTNLKVFPIDKDPYYLPFEKAFNMVSEDQKLSSFLVKDAHYETGAALEFGMDKLGIPWKPLIEDSKTKPGKTQYDILRDYFKIDERKDLDAKIEEIKSECNYDDLKGVSNKIMENINSRPQ